MPFETRDYNFEEHKKGGPEVFYQSSELDSSGAPAIAYYGFLTDDGHGMIQQITPTSIRYYECKNKAAYLAAWAGRAGLTYSYYCDLAGQ